MAGIAAPASGSSTASQTQHSRQTSPARNPPATMRQTSAVKEDHLVPGPNPHSVGGTDERSRQARHLLPGSVPPQGVPVPQPANNPPKTTTTIDKTSKTKRDGGKSACAEEKQAKRKADVQDLMLWVLCMGVALPGATVNRMNRVVALPTPRAVAHVAPHPSAAYSLPLSLQFMSRIACTWCVLPMPDGLVGRVADRHCWSYGHDVWCQRFLSRPVIDLAFPSPKQCVAGSRCAQCTPPPRVQVSS